MTIPQPAEIASTNSDGARGNVVCGAFGRYLEDLAGQPLAARTRDAYGAHVSAYIGWLAERPGADAALREPRARDHAARDFKRHLTLERRWAPTSVNLGARQPPQQAAALPAHGAQRLVQVRGVRRDERAIGRLEQLAVRGR